MDSIKEGLSMGKDRKNSNDVEAMKGTSSDIPDDLPLDFQALVATIASLNKTIETLTKANESNNRINESNNKTIQELTRQNADQSEKINELIGVVASMNEQLKRIKSSKSNDSSNSSLPPSASNPAKSTGNLTPKKAKKSFSLRKKTQEKPGRLPGHEGSGMRLKTVSDRFVDLFPEGCSGCGNLVSCMQHGKVCDTRYTKDIEFVEIQTEYKSWVFECPNKANQTVQGAFPNGVTGSKQYGESIKILMVLLKFIGLVSCKRIAKLCSSLGFDFSTGTIHSICKSYAGQCTDAKSLIVLLLQSSGALGMDETGGNVNGSKIWHHTTVSEDATLITAHKGRGLLGTLASGVMQEFTGILEHDFWSPYFNLEHVTHAMCAAHLERENNKAQADNPKLKWPTMMNDLFHDLESLRKEFQQLGFERIPEEVLLPYLKRYDDILETGADEDPFPLVGKKLKKNGEPRKPAFSGPQNLRKRYEKYKEEILRFASDFDVPVSNNFAERSFRFFKVAYGVFGCFRTETGTSGFSMASSVFDTGRKQGKTLKDIASSIFNKNYLDIFNDESRAFLMANGAIPTLA